MAWKISTKTAEKLSSIADVGGSKIGMGMECP
jgi:hypothetical protein